MSDLGNLDRPVLVTGATGFIAMQIIAQLLEGGQRVRGTVRSQARADQVRAVLARRLEASGFQGDRLELVQTDLLADAGWADAVRGCHCVMHVASPVPRSPPKHEDELIVPARDGTMRVLRAAVAQGVQRVIMTSSVAAVVYGHARDGSTVFDESYWTDLNARIGAYEKSKTIAERAAWDYVESLEGGQLLEFCTINPGLVMGPVMDKDFSTSGEVVRKLMCRELPGIPDIGYCVVDVRDVADAHITAMTAPGAPGNRFIVAIEHAHFSEIAKILAEEFGPRGYKIPTRRLPSFVLRLVALWDKTARLAVPELGKRQDVSCQRAKDLLNWQPRPLREMVVAMGESMIDHGIV